MTNQVQCSNCNSYKIIRSAFRVNPKTGTRHSQGACLTEFYKFISIPIGVIGIIIFVILGLTVNSLLFLAAIAIGAAMAWRVKLLSEYEKSPVGYDHFCENCGKEWTVNPKI